MAPTTSADSGSSKPNQPYDILENGYLIPSEDTILIAVMGVTGSGKSQLINTLKAERVIYNKDNGGKRESIYAEVGKGLKSQTRNLEFFYLTLDGHGIILVDTPGFNDAKQSDTDILEKIATWLAATAVNKRYLSGICYIHKIDDTRFGRTADENLIMLQKLCGSDGMTNVKLVMSMWDKSRGDPAIAATFEANEQELRDEFWSDLLEDGAIMVRAYNDSKSLQACIRSIIGSARKPLALQDQLIKERRPLFLTDIGKRVMENTRTFQSEVRSKLKELEKLESQAQKEHRMLSRPLLRQKQKLMDDLEEARQQLERLEKWTLGEIARDILPPIGGGVTLTAVGTAGLEAGLSAWGYEAAAASLAAGSLPIVALGGLAGATVGGLWWYNNWKKRKDDAAEQVRQLERNKIIEENEDERAQREIKEEDQRKRGELCTSYEYRMRLAYDLLMDKWYKRVPEDPDGLKVNLEEILPTNSPGWNRYLLVCGWEFPGTIQGFFWQDTLISKEELQSNIEQTVIIVGSDPYFRITTIGSYLEVNWGTEGKEILRIATEAVYDGIQEIERSDTGDALEKGVPEQEVPENEQTRLPLAGTWPPDLLSPSPLRLYVYSLHVILQLSTTDKDCNVRDQNKKYVEALLWFCQATRAQRGESKPELSSRPEELNTNSDGQAEGSRVSFYIMRKMERINPVAPGFCWASLFKKVVVAEADIDREWKEAKGLELSYELMVELAAVETPVEVIAEEASESQSEDEGPWPGSFVQDSTGSSASGSTIEFTDSSASSGTIDFANSPALCSTVDSINLSALGSTINFNSSVGTRQGIVLVGFFTALVPIRHKSDTILWHFEDSDPMDRTGSTIDPHQLESVATRQSWFQTRDLDLLKSQKCILGWWNEADVMLGTPSLHNDVQFGKRDSIRKWTSHVKGTNSTVQLGAPGMIPINVSTTITSERVSNIQRFDPATLYLAALDRASLETALIYDTSSHQAWLVQKLSLLLHMCHSYIMTYQDPSTDPIPFVQPSPNPSKDIKSILQDAAEIPIAVGSNVIYPLSALLVSLNSSLVNSTLTEESVPQSFFRKTRLLARQYMDIIEQPSRGSGLTVANAQDYFPAWKDLIEAVDSVLICANLGQAIQPKALASCPCNNIPTGRSLLVAHSWCLERILARRGNGQSLMSLMTCSVDLTQGYSWKLRGNAFSECSTQNTTSPWEDSDAPLQKLSARRRFFPGSHDPVLRNLDQIPSIKGAVVFGSR